MRTTFLRLRSLHSIFGHSATFIPPIVYFILDLEKAEQLIHFQRNDLLEERRTSIVTQDYTI